LLFVNQKVKGQCCWALCRGDVGAGRRYILTRAVLSQGEPSDTTVNFYTYRILQRHRAVSLPQHGFLV